jgi:hypothetical protein
MRKCFNKPALVNQANVLAVQLAEASNAARSTAHFLHLSLIMIRVRLLEVAGALSSTNPARCRGAVLEPTSTKVADQDNPTDGDQSYVSVMICIVTYLFHGSDSVHLVNLRSETLDLYADVGAFFNDLLTIVGPLRRRCIRVECDIRWDHLHDISGRVPA